MNLLKDLEKKQFASLFEIIPFQLAILDGDGRILRKNAVDENFDDNYTLTPDMGDVGQNYVSFCRDTETWDGIRLADGIQSVLDGYASDFRMEYSCEMNGEVAWFLVEVFPVQDPDLDYCLMVQTNITERRHSQKWNRRLAAIVNEIPVCIVTLKVINSKGNGSGSQSKSFIITNLNTHAETVTGLSRKDVIGQNYRDVFDDLFGRDLKSKFYDVMTSGENYHSDEVHSEGAEFAGTIWSLQVFKVTHDYIAIVFEDVTDEVSYRQQLEYLATYDDVTGLPNRDHLLNTFRDELKRANRYDTELTFLLLDLDHFKKVNDTYGHVPGDELLKKVGTILTNHTRSSDTSGRYGGEEFGVVLPETGEDDAYKFAERLRKDIEKMTLTVSKGKEVSVTCSIGLSERQTGDTEIKDILRRTDKSLYEAKARGRNRVECWTDMRTEDRTTEAS